MSLTCGLSAHSQPDHRGDAPTPRQGTTYLFLAWGARVPDKAEEKGEVSRDKQPNTVSSPVLFHPAPSISTRRFKLTPSTSLSSISNWNKGPEESSLEKLASPREHMQCLPTEAQHTQAHCTSKLCAHM